ncbi:hypothetical protein DL96DRAFT_1817351 [Flagelloscypha sp. PMI_526]|nr:hypothetical protein DL96DRAFT_1817351 [Flagelloscypha sp. PMI_526]
MSNVPRLPLELQIQILRFAARHVWAQTKDITQYLLVSTSAYESISFDLYHTISITQYRQISPLIEVVESKPPSFFALRTRGLFLRFGHGEDGRVGWQAAWEALWKSVVPKLTTLQYLYADDISTTDMPTPTMKFAFKAVRSLTQLKHFFLGHALTRFVFAQNPPDVSWDGAFVTITHLQLYPFSSYGLDFILTPGYIQQELGLLRRFTSLTHLMFVVHKDGEVSCAVQIIESFTSLKVIAVVVADSDEMAWAKLTELRSAGGKDSNAVEMELWQGYDLGPGKFKEVAYGSDGNVWAKAEEKLAAKKKGSLDSYYGPDIDSGTADNLPRLQLRKRPGQTGNTGDNGAAQAQIPEELQIHTLRLAARNINTKGKDVKQYLLVSRAAYEMQVISYNPLFFSPLMIILSISYDAFHTIIITSLRQVAPLVKFIESKPPAFLALRTRGLFLQFGYGKDEAAGLQAWKMIWQTAVPKLIGLRYLHAGGVNPTDMPLPAIHLALSTIRVLSDLRHFFICHILNLFLLTLHPLDVWSNGSFSSITHIQFDPLDCSDFRFILSPGYIQGAIRVLRQFKSLTHLMFVVHEGHEISSAVQVIGAFTSLKVIVVVVADKDKLPVHALQELRAAGGGESNVVELELSQGYEFSPRMFKEMTYETDRNVWVKAEEMLATRGRTMAR